MILFILFFMDESSLTKGRMPFEHTCYLNNAYWHCKCSGQRGLGLVRECGDSFSFMHLYCPCGHVYVIYLCIRVRVVVVVVVVVALIVVDDVVVVMVVVVVVGKFWSSHILATKFNINTLDIKILKSTLESTFPHVISPCMRTNFSCNGETF